MTYNLQFGTEGVGASAGDRMHRQWSAVVSLLRVLVLGSRSSETATVQIKPFPSLFCNFLQAIEPLFLFSVPNNASFSRQTLSHKFFMISTTLLLLLQDSVQLIQIDIPKQTNKHLKKSVRVYSWGSKKVRVYLQGQNCLL